ncbi:MAG TPA: hypothetical protein VKD26_09575 [Streptosporangiaceae bacterium]|nr:hypothetical protein [Streptosporangiaceae bacterium]
MADIQDLGADELEKLAAETRRRLGRRPHPGRTAGTVAQRVARMIPPEVAASVMSCGGSKVLVRRRPS